MLRIAFLLTVFVGCSWGGLSKLSKKQVDTINQHCGRHPDPWAATAIIYNTVTEKRCMGTMFTPMHILTTTECLLSENGTFFDYVTMHRILNVSMTGWCKSVEGVKHHLCNTTFELIGYVAPVGYAETHLTRAVVLLDVREKECDPSGIFIFPYREMPCTSFVKPFISDAMKAIRNDGPGGSKNFKFDNPKTNNTPCATCGPIISADVEEKMDSPGGLYYIRYATNQMKGLIPSTNDWAIELDEYLGFMCAHTRLCGEKDKDYMTKLPRELQSFIENGQLKQEFEAYASNYQQTHLDEHKACSPDHLYTEVDRVTPFRRLTTEQSDFLRKQCGSEKDADEGNQREEHDYLAGIFVFSNTSYKGMCSGALITHRHVITSLECIRQLSRDVSTPENDAPEVVTLAEVVNIYVQIGGTTAVPSNIIVGNDDIPNVSRVRSLIFPFCENTSPNNECRMVYDIALVEIEGEAQFDTIRPICLQNDHVTAQPEKVVVIGYASYANSSASVSETVLWSPFNSFDDAQSFKLKKQNTDDDFDFPSSLMILAHGAPVTFEENGMRYLAGVFSPVKSTAGHHNMAASIVAVKGFICFHTGNCPDGPVQDNNLNILMPNIQTFDISNRFLLTRLQLGKTFAQHPTTLITELEKMFAEVRVHAKNDLRTTRKILTSEEYEAVERECSHNKSTQQARIHFGTPIEPGTQPWFAAMYVPISTDQNMGLNNAMYPRCSGAFVSPWHVLTSKHCTQAGGDFGKRIDPRDMVIGYGVDCYTHMEIDRDNLTIQSVLPLGDSKEYCPENTPNPKLLRVRNIIRPIGGMHQFGHNNVTFSDHVYYDFAIIELTEERRDVSYLCLPRKDESYTEHVISVGKGRDARNHHKFGQVQYMEIAQTGGPHIHHNKTYRWTTPVSHGIPQIGLGDSGGPIIRETGYTPERKILFAINQGILQNNFYRDNTTDENTESKNVTMRATLVSEALPFICELVGLCPRGTRDRDNVFSDVGFNSLSICNFAD